MTLLLSAQPGPYGRRSLLAIDPDDVIVSPPGAGAGLPAIPPRLVHTAQGRGVWIGAISYDAGLGLLGIASRHEPVVPALVAGYHATYAVYDHERDAWSIEGPPGAARDALAAAAAAEPAPRAGRRAAGPALGAQPGHARRATPRRAARCSG